MDTLSLILSSCLLIIPILISRKEKLNLEKDIIISVSRAIIQLAVVGYILEFIFGLQSKLYTVILVLIMIFNASLNTKKRGEGIKNVVAISFVALVIGCGITLSILVMSGAIEFTSEEVIPVAGMVISNAMVAIGLSYRNLNNNLKNKRAEVEVKLSLGSDIKDASIEIIRECVKMSMIPSIDSAKTLGIVSLPGMMTGLILGGASPILAIKFQIMVTFMLISSTSISSMIATYVSYRHFFNDRKQLNI